MQKTHGHRDIGGHAFLYRISVSSGGRMTSNSHSHLEPYEGNFAEIDRVSRGEMLVHARMNVKVPKLHPKISSKN